MDTNMSIEYAPQEEEDIWIDQIKSLHLNGRLCDWVTTFHPQKLLCSPMPGIIHGSYNLIQEFLFEDGTVWLLRFPRVSNVSPEYVDEKVATEVGTLFNPNPLELGPFILMEFIEGVSLGEALKKDDGSRLLREDIPERDVEFVYRQMANIMLRLFEIDFDRIESLPTPKTGYSVPIRPLTWKTHDILRTGGVNTFGDRARGFSTITGYFQYINRQDWKQFRHQPNTVIAGELDGITTYASLDMLKSMMPQFVDTEYEKGPFKLICDYFSLANMIVKSREDLTIVGVVGLEWVYAGPAQMFASGPWWLLLNRPINTEWDFQVEDPPEVNERYFKSQSLQEGTGGRRGKITQAPRERGGL
ncbi:hypothetical protein SI65_02721 [Aspergillus cristatus]|uniref:Aminoglycoside phosphotransferase domain-containing protein n=1 Tax=Aspergillus cristatus TaxID=573508 RepID=A0A1E3BLV7_ASPCR|nr:hypothetical protein SI65_02721 [Aspergillus cristatus]